MQIMQLLQTYVKEQFNLLVLFTSGIIPDFITYTPKTYGVRFIIELKLSQVIPKRIYQLLQNIVK